MKTIFLFIPNYVYSSDFLHTEFIGYLVSKFRVVIFAPEGVLVDDKLQLQSPNLVHIKWKIQYPRFWNLFGKFLRYSLIRKYDFEPVIQRNRKKGMRDWRRRALRFFSYLLPAAWLTPDFFSRLEILLVPKSELFLKYAEKYQPAMVITPTPGFTHFDAEAIVLAKKSHLPTAAINFSWDNLHNGGPHFRRVDYLIVWNEIIKNTAIKEYGYPENRVFVSGIMRFDHYFKKQPRELSREEFLKSKNLDPREKLILITTVTKGNYPDEHLVLKDLLEARDKNFFNGFPNILIRMHPKEEVKNFTSFLDAGIRGLCVEKAGKEKIIELGSNIEMDEDDLLNLKHTLKYCDLNINYLSTITLEAFVFDKPVININYPPQYHLGYTFSHYKPLIEMKSVRLVYSFEELINNINIYFKNPNLEYQERQAAFEKYIKFSDGFSYRRNVDFLCSVLYE